MILNPEIRENICFLESLSLTLFRTFLSPTFLSPCSRCKARFHFDSLAFLCTSQRHPLSPTLLHSSFPRPFCA